MTQSAKDPVTILVGIDATGETSSTNIDQESIKTNELPSLILAEASWKPRHEIERNAEREQD